MRISDIISPAAISARASISDKDGALKLASENLAARSGLSADRIHEALAAREELGSTGIGRGVAVPHVCLPSLDRSYAWFCSLAYPIDFDSIDNEPVDLICTIISPESAKSGTSECLSHLAAITRVLRDGATASALRKASNPWEIYDIIVKSTEAGRKLAS
jgi:nitrogen PTS system EIIA component